MTAPSYVELLKQNLQPGFIRTMILNTPRSTLGYNGPDLKMYWGILSLHIIVTKSHENTVRCVWSMVCMEKLL